MKTLLFLLSLACTAAMASSVLFKRRGGANVVSAGGYDEQTAVFDGAADFMSLSNNPPGLVDGKAFTASFWIKFNGGDGVQQYIVSNNEASANRFFIYKTSLNKMAMLAYNSTTTKVLDVIADTDLTVASGWTHVYMCANLAAAGSVRIYYNGSAQSLTTNTFSNSTIEWVADASPKWTICADRNGATRVNAALSEMWWNDSYLDDLTKFASEGCPISLGVNGELPIGSSPVFYFKDSGNSFTNSYGTSPNFVINGSFGTETAPCP